MPTPAPNTYPFDGSGTAATNLVSNENQSLTLTNYRDYNFVIPNFAPFFADSLKVKHKETVTSPLTTLTEGIDYYPALSFVGATRATAKPVYGAISFTNLKLTGFLEITYQTVGGEWTLSVQKITELAANVIYNPRTTTWETLVNVPAYFPPLDHAWKLDDLVGQKEVLAELDSIEKAILNRDTDANLLAHATNYSNPHRTSKTQVGLAKVMNYAPATLAESVEARRNDLYATPAGVKAFIDSLGLDKDLSFVSLEEVVTRKSVPKILTFDLFLEYMKLYGGSANTAPIDTGNLDRPIVIYPQELDNFLKGQPFKCTTYVDVIPGTITRIMDLTGTGTHTIPRGTNTLSITGRGGIGTEYVANFVVKTKTVSGMGSGSFIVPAGGNVLSLRGRGAPGFISNDIGVYKPTNNGSLVNLPTPVVNPGDPTWTYELVSKFSSSYVINSIMNSIVLTIDLKKNYSNNLSVISNNIPCTLLLTNKSTDGILLTYKGSFTTAFSDTTLLSADFELKFERLPGTNISSGNEVTVTINTATIKFPGSTDLLSPNARIDDITLNPNVNAVVNYSSPAGTELDIIYQDFTNTGEWKITKYYSSKITNSSTGSSTLVEDTIGNVVVLPLAVTGEYMADKTSITLDVSPVLNTPHTLTLVTSESTSNKRVFEDAYTIGNTIVSVKVISEYVLNTGLQSKGPDALVTVFNTVHKFDGSPDNDTLPITRTDDIILDINSATTLTYNCPAGASVVLEYKEPNSAQPIAHSDTEWEVSKADSFISANILDSTVLGKGTGFSLTTWKPTHADTFINNSDYYVRCRWVKSDATKSDWSDTRKFIFSVGAVNQPKDKELSRWCIGLDQWGTYADGNGGSYDRIISNNSVACGYVTPAPTGAQANTITVQLLSDLNVAYSGHNVIFTAVIGNTKAGSIYECELQQKYITESDYNYSKVNVSTITSSFTGDANTTTLKFSLAYSDIGAGNRVFKYRVTQSGFPVNTAVSTPININFTTPVTDNPIPTGPTPSTTNVLDDNNLKLTLTSSRTDIRIGDNEVLTVMLTGGIPGNEYQLLMITKNSTRLNDNGTTSLIRITANNSGTGTFTKDGGNDGSIPLGLYFTTVETLGRPIKVTSGTISRNFLGAYTNPRIVCSIIGSNDIDIGETRMARVDISGFEPSKTYTLRWYRTVPNTANRSVWNLNGTQITNNVVTSASGTGSIEIPVSNDGTLDSGAWRFDVDAYDSITNALVPTPGGNVEGVYNILINTSISIVSNISYPSPIYTNTVERITYTVSRAAPNRTINFVSRSTFVSGNTALLGGGTLDTNTPVDTLITVTTGSTGSATVVKEFRNVDNRIPGGSVWQRQALLTGTSTVSNILQSKYANSAISFKIESLRINSGNSAINKNDPDTITYGLSGLQSDIRYTVKWLYKVNTGPWIPAANIADTGFNSTSDRYSSSISPLIVSPNTTDQTHTLYLKAIVYDNNNNPTESNDLQWNYNNPSLQAFSPSLTSVKNGTAINKGAVDSITLNITNVKQSRYTLTWYTILDSNKTPIFNNALPSEITPTATTFNGSYTVPIDVGSVVQPRTLKYGVDIVEVVTNTTRSPTELSYTYSDQNNSFTIGISCGKPLQTVNRNSTDTISIVAQNLTPNATYRLNWYYQLGSSGGRVPLNDPALPTTINVNSSSTTINRIISVGYGVVCSSLTSLNYYVEMVDSNNVSVSSDTPSGVHWTFDPSITATLRSSKTTITNTNNRDTLSLTLNNLELNNTYQLTWYYRLDADTNERHTIPNPNSAGLPGTIVTTDKNSVAPQYTNVLIGKDIPLTDANSLIFYSVAINKQGDLTELIESTKCSWIWSTGNTAIRLPIATASLGTSGIITLPIGNDNNVVMLNGTVSQLELNKLYKAEWYVTLPDGTETLISVNGNSSDSFSEISSTSHNLTFVPYTIPKTISPGSISFRLFVYQNDDKSRVYDSSTINVVVNPAAAVIVPKPLINLTPVSTDPNPLTGVGGTVYLRAYVDSLIATETYDLTWEILKPNTISAITLSGLPTTVSGRTSDTINTNLNTGAMNIPGTTAGKLNIKLTITQRSNNTNNNSSNIDVSVEPAPIITPVEITDISSTERTFSLENTLVSTTLSISVNGILIGNRYAVVWRQKLPLSNTKTFLGEDNLSNSGGAIGYSSGTYSLNITGSSPGLLSVIAEIYEVKNGIKQTAILATDNITINLTLPQPGINLSVVDITPSTGITTSTVNGSVDLNAYIDKLVETKSYDVTWQVKYPNVDMRNLPAYNSTISGLKSKNIPKTIQLTDTGSEGDVTFYVTVKQTDSPTNFITGDTSINISQPNIAKPVITNVKMLRQDSVTSYEAGEANVAVNLSADVSNLTGTEFYDFIWEYSINNGAYTNINSFQLDGKGLSYVENDRVKVDGGLIDLSGASANAVLEVRLKVTSVTSNIKTNSGKTTKTIIAHVVKTPIITGISNNITAFTAGTNVTGNIITTKFNNLSLNDTYNVRFYYKLPGANDPSYVGTTQSETGVNPANEITKTSSAFPVNILGTTPLNSSIIFGSEVYNTVTNSIKDTEEVSYLITAIGAPTITSLDSTKVAYLTSETINTSLTANVNGLITTETYDVRWEALLNGSPITITGTTPTVRGGTSASLTASVNGINSGTNANGSIVYKLTVTSQTNNTMKAYKDLTYGISAPGTPSISNLSVTGTFTPGNTSKQASFSVFVGSLLPNKQYIINWLYKTNLMNDFVDLNSNTTGITSANTSATGSGNFIPGTSTSVVFKAVISMVGDSNVTANTSSNSIDIKDTTVVTPPTTNTLSTATIGTLSSSISSFILNNAFTTTLSAQLTTLTSGVTYNCSWYYIIDDSNSKYRQEVLLGSNTSNSNTGSANASFSVPSTTIGNRVANDNTSRKITFKVVVTATGTNTTPLSVTSDTKSQEYNVNYTGSGTGTTISTPNITGLVATNAPFTAPTFNPSLRMEINGNSLTPNTFYSVTTEYTVNGGTNWYNIGLSTGSSIYLNSATTGTYNHNMNLSTIPAGAGSIQFRATITQGSSINVTKLSDSTYDINAASSGSTPTLSFGTTPTISGAASSAFTGNTVTLNVSNITINTSISLDGVKHNGINSIIHNGSPSYTLTIPGNHPNTTGTSYISISASYPGATTATGSVTVNTTSSGTGGSVTISSLTATNSNTFVQGTTPNSPKLTASFTGLTPGTNYTLRWYLSYDNGVSPQLVTNLKDDALPTNINAPFTLSATATTATKNVTIDPIAFSNNTKVRFKVVLVLPDGITEIPKQTDTNYDINFATNPGSLSATLKVDGGTTLNKNDKTAVSLSVVISGATVGTKYEFMNQYRNSTEAWIMEDNSNYLIADANGNQWTSVNKPAAVAATSTTHTINLTVYTKNRTTSSITKKLSLLVYKQGDLPVTGVTSSEVTLTIGAGSPTISLPNVNIDFNTISQNNYEVYWEDFIPVSITVNNAVPNTNYDWTVAISEVGTSANLANLSQWTYGTDLWGTRSHDPMTASRGALKLNGTATTYTLDRTVLENAWGLLNPIRDSNNTIIPDGAFREIQVAILAYAGDVDTLTTTPTVDKVILSNLVKIKFWQKNNQPTITLASTGPFNLYWDDSFVIGGNGSNLQNLKIGASYNYTYAVSDISTTNDIQSVRDGKWHFGNNPFDSTITDPTSPSVTKNLLTNITSTFMLIPDVMVSSPWNNNNRVAGVALNEFKEVKACVVAHIVTPNLDIDKVVLSPMVIVRIWNRPKNGPVAINYTPTVSIGLWLDRAMKQLNAPAQDYLYWTDTGQLSISVSTPHSGKQLGYIFRYHNGTGDPYRYDNNFSGSSSTDMNSVSKIPLPTTGPDGSTATASNVILTNPYNSSNQTADTEKWLFVSIVVSEMDGSNSAASAELTLVCKGAAP